MCLRAYFVLTLKASQLFSKVSQPQQASLNILKILKLN